MLALLTRRFARGAAGPEGSGLGLAIAAAIADRIESALVLRSPRTGGPSGFETEQVLPVSAPAPSMSHVTPRQPA